MGAIVCYSWLAVQQYAIAEPGMETRMKHRYSFSPPHHWAPLSWLILITLAACSAPSATAFPNTSTFPPATQWRTSTPTSDATSTLLPSRTSLPATAPPGIVTPATAVPVEASTPNPGAAPIVPVTQPPDGRYLLLWYQFEREGTGDLLYQFEPFGGDQMSPGCDFDPAAGTLARLIGQPFVLRPDDWGIWCQNYAMSGSVSRQRDRTARADIIAQVPYSQRGGIKWPTAVTMDGSYQWHVTTVDLVAVAADGTVELRIDGERIVLAPGESWQHGEQIEVVSSVARGTYRELHRVTNYGWHDRALLAPRQIRIMVTTDGGATWALRRVDLLGVDQHISGWYIECPAASVCYVAESGGQVLVGTTDGGQTWAQHALPIAPELGAFSCPAVGRCFVGDAITGRIVATTDGGASWREQYGGLGIGLAALDCPRPQSCFAGGPEVPLESAEGWIAATTDGGARWQMQATNLPYSIASISCATAQVCMAAGRSAGLLLLTTDGGRTWEQTPFPSAHGVYEVSCPDASTCFLMPFGGQSLWATSDSGRTWTEITIPLVEKGVPEAPICPTAEQCFLRGRHVVYWTTNGGRTWENHSFWETGLSPTYAMACPEVGTCFVVLYPTGFG